MKRLVPLEPQAEKVCNEASKPPLIFQLPPEKGREVLEKMQDSQYTNIRLKLKDYNLNLITGELLKYILLFQATYRESQALSTIYMGLDGYLVVFIHMKSWFGNLQQEPIQF